MKKKERNIIAYYASEENAYEISKTKGEVRETLASIRLDLVDEGVSETVTEKQIQNLKDGLEKDGYGIIEVTNCHEYQVIYAVAYHGNTKPITSMLKERRQEITSMF